MAFSRSLSLSLCIFLPCFLSLSQAYTFYVGGKDGWVLDPSESYDNWANRNRFQVNDVLVFKYARGSDSVLVVSKEDYDKCDLNNPVVKLEDGNSEFKFDRSGAFYFVSGKPGSCENGQKLVVVVMSLRSLPPPSKVGSPPPYGAQPPEVSPSPPGAESPSRTPTSPSPSGATSPGMAPVPPSASPPSETPSSSSPSSGTPSSPPSSGTPSSPSPSSMTPTSPSPSPSSLTPTSPSPSPGTPTLLYPPSETPTSPSPSESYSPRSSYPGAQSPYGSPPYGYGYETPPAASPTSGHGYPGARSPSASYTSPSPSGYETPPAASPTSGYGYPGARSPSASYTSPSPSGYETPTTTPPAGSPTSPSPGEISPSVSPSSPLPGGTAVWWFSGKFPAVSTVIFLRTGTIADWIVRHIFNSVSNFVRFHNSGVKHGPQWRNDYELHLNNNNKKKEEDESHFYFYYLVFVNKF
ncbi:early nodulin-like protein 2 [Benincasa hispida]|uniref:early nodulin-like protein 2 n=1 Tax=Benincasa hispida TaxID=102211 RepID=UPI0019002627|nr:early nodulin-like protein 2 [Benincasa hispida]